MKRILIVTPYENGFGGVEVITQALSKLLKENNFQVEFLTLDFLRTNGFLERLKFKLIGPQFLTAKKYKELNINDYDYVVANGEFAYGIDHPKAINYFHGSYFGFLKYNKRKLSLKTKLRLILSAYLQKKSAKGKVVITVSEFMKNILEEQGIQVHHIIPNFVDLEKFHPFVKEKRRDFIFAGRYDYFGKGFDVLERLAKDNLEITCYSDCNQEQFPKLKILPPISHDQFNDVLNLYKILIFPSRFESFGLVPAEAMAAGLPVLINDVGVGAKLKKEIPDFVIDNFLDIDEVNRKIFRIKADYENYSIKAREYAQANFSQEKFKEKWLEVLNA